MGRVNATRGAVESRGCKKFPNWNPSVVPWLRFDSCSDVASSLCGSQFRMFFLYQNIDTFLTLRQQYF